MVVVALQSRFESKLVLSGRDSGLTVRLMVQWDQVVAGIKSLRELLPLSKRASETFW